LSATDNKKLHVAVLMGGSSNERNVSLSTGRQIAAALDASKYLVSCVDTRDLLSLTGQEPHRIGASGSSEATSISQPHGRADIVFIALHGTGGEDGTVQGMLEFLGLPYTGSGVLASALAMNKSVSKQLFAAAGIPVITGVTVTSNDADQHGLPAMAQRIIAEAGPDVFVKPNAEGSTFGCTLVQNADTNPEKLQQALAHALTFDSTVLAERYTRGVEITAGVLEDETGTPQALPLVEIVPKSQYYDYESKYAAGGSEHVIPARLTAEQTRTAQEQALKCHHLLGCSGMSRTDMIVTNDMAYVLEVNTIPGMTPTSLLPHAADTAGIPFTDMLDRIVASGWRRFHREAKEKPE
jgi:D-alanine-D-alanine ligase